MNANFESVQSARNAALNRNSVAPVPEVHELAQRIVAAAQGDARVAYDYLDVLNKHVNKELKGRRDG